MYSRFRHRLVLWFEQLVMRGPLAQLGIVAVLLIGIALLSGMLIRQLDPSFESNGEALWWAFEHVLVPEFIDGDDNFARRAVGTVLIIVSAMLFIGTVVAILVQWMNSVRERLELGLTPISEKGHFVMLGWTNRTSAIVRSIALSNRFARRPGGRRLRLAILADRASAALMQHLRALLGREWRNGQIILRTGSALNTNDMQRVDIAGASVVVLPAADAARSKTVDADTRTIKSLMSLDMSVAQLTPSAKPLVVAELQDLRHSKTLPSLYKGPMEIIAGDEIIAKFLVQSVRYPGLSHVYTQLLTDVDRNEHFTLQDPRFEGLSAGQLVNAFSEGIFLGVVKQRGDSFEALLNPPDDLKVGPGDRIAVLGVRHAGGAALDLSGDLRPPVDGGMTHVTQDVRRRILILGWNRRVPLLLREFSEVEREKYSIDIVSVVPAKSREEKISAAGVSIDRLQVSHSEFDYTVPGKLENLDLVGYDNVVLLASERIDTGADSDARSILGYVLLRQNMGDVEPLPSVLVELLDANNVTLFDHRRGEILVTPSIVSHLLSRVALHRELRTVFDELFGSTGSEIRFRPLSDYGLAGEYLFSALQEAAREANEIAIGIRQAGQIRTPTGGVELNPGRDKLIQLNSDDELIVVCKDDRRIGAAT